MQLSYAKILVVDDDPDVLVAAQLLLKTEVRQVVAEKNPEQIRAHLTHDRFDLILLDMNYKSKLHSGNEGLYWLRQIKEWDKDATVVMITAYGDIDLAVRSVKEGAADFIVKPWRNDKLLVSLEEVLANKKATGGQLRRKSDNSDIGIIGESDVMQSVFYKIKKIAPTDANVLILSENGTGIPAEMIECIFIPFFSTNQSGSGIGLSLSPQIMFLHKGNIQVRSAGDKGSRFMLIFPA